MVKSPNIIITHSALGEGFYAHSTSRFSGEKRLIAYRRLGRASLTEKLDGLSTS